MQVLRSVQAFRLWRNTVTQQSIGFVPTMGYLHQGHISLVHAARQHNQQLVVSLFVNPTQFAPGEDLDDYPRNEQSDFAILQENHVDVVFAPETQAMYAPNARVDVRVRDILNTAEGNSRPTHFDGVATVCTKLFNIVQPNNVYFGQKDAMQCIVLKNLIRDLNFDINMNICPTVREVSGLAMSSRNAYLTDEEKISALVLSHGLFAAEKAFNDGLRDPIAITEIVRSNIRSDLNVNEDYVNIADFETGNTIENSMITGETLLSAAVHIGNTRLIDNIILRP